MYFSRLTEKEKQERHYKKQLLTIAKEHEKARELERVQRYHMPAKDKKEEYVEVDESEKFPNSEQKKWEAEQLASAMYQFGAKDAKAQEEYDLLLDDQIDFIQALTMEGSKEKKEQADLSEKERKKMDIEETKKSLPVYPFKDDLIAAIREHQVMYYVI